jgi:hypothetical protein
MATHDYVIANGSGGAVRSDLNNALAAIVSNNSSATEPTTTYAYMWWADTTSGQLKLRNGADSAWVVIRELDGTMLMESGTAGAPGLAFASDLDTGIYSPGANQLAISTSGTGWLFVDAGGRVGIGTANPGRGLVVDGISDNVVAAFQTTAATCGIGLKSGTTTADNTVTLRAVGNDFVTYAGGTERLRITSDGKVGVGTSSPGEQLELGSGNIKLAPIGRIFSTDGTRGSVQISAPNDSTSRRVTYGNNYYLDSDLAYKQESANIGGSLIEMTATNNTYGSFKFIQKQDPDLGGATRDALVIDSSGNVGIGTTSPLKELQVGDFSGTNEILIGAGTAGNSNVVFGDGSTGNASYRGSIQYAHSDDSLSFSTAAAERARIDSSGRLLVGTNISTDTQNYLGNSYGGPSIQQHGTAQREAALAVYNWGNSVASPAALVLNKSLGNAVGTRGALTNTNQDIGVITFTGDDGTTFLPAATILAETDGTPGTDQMPGRIVFMTNSGDSEANPVERMRITSNAEVLIGTTDPIQPTTSTQNGVEINATAKRIKASRDGDAPLTLQRTSSDGDIADFYRDTTLVGSISVTTSATAYNTSSDYRLKENVVALTGAADRVNQLQVHRFNFIADPDTTVDGFLAHEAQAVVPEAVTGTHDGVDADGNPVYQGIDQSKLVPLLTAALQEALAEIESLKARVTALEP